MSGKESLRNGIILVALLIGFGVISAVWPILTGTSTQASTRLPLETEHIEMTLPVLGDVSWTSLQVLGALAILIVGPIVVIGAGLGIASVIASRQVAQVKESNEKFDAAQASGIMGLIYKPILIINNFIRKSGEKYAGRKTHPVPAHKMPRWSVASTSIIILMFVAFFGLIINGTFYPESELDLQSGQVIKSAWLTVGIPVLLALLIILWRIRPQRLESSSADTVGIPWDFIAVLLTGLLIVGLGIGLIVYLNIPV